tara:strand:- start:6533 stop:6874 length:342 start_codon:yes stop_codon:yes gene_type:complete
VKSTPTQDSSRGLNLAINSIAKAKITNFKTIKNDGLTARAQAMAGLASSTPFDMAKRVSTPSRKLAKRHTAIQTWCIFFSSMSWHLHISKYAAAAVFLKIILLDLLMPQQAVL